VDYDYGYDDLGNQLLKLFWSGAPDFAAAEELIRQGADVNVLGKHDDENILSEILMGYWQTAFGDSFVDDCEPGLNLNPNPGPAMCAIIRFFLEHGFDVNKCDGCYGAQCLSALALSTFDRYIIEATKILLDAGAKNRTVSPTRNDPEDTPRGSIVAEGTFQDVCERNHSVGNIYEAVYQIYEAVEEGRPHGGIDFYETAAGKTIRNVLAEKNEDCPVFFAMNLPEFKRENCFRKNLYFVYEGGVLTITPYAAVWTDNILPDADLVDVSKHFTDIVGSRIRGFAFDHRSVQRGTECYGQPIIIIETDSGRKIRFSINFGEVREAERAAFYELLDG